MGEARGQAPARARVRARVDVRVCVCVLYARLHAQVCAFTKNIGMQSTYLIYAIVICISHLGLQSAPPTWPHLLLNACTLRLFSLDWRPALFLTWGRWAGLSCETRLQQLGTLFLERRQGELATT